MKMIPGLTATDEMAQHPAFLAWSQIAGAGSACGKIELLKDRDGSQVWRLKGMGPGGSDLIAKRCAETQAVTEERIYRQILLRLPMDFLRRHQLVRENGTGYCWAFVEDAAGEPYSARIPEHGAAVGKWLARLHTSASILGPLAELADRDWPYYCVCLRAGQLRIRELVARPCIGEEHRALLDFLLRVCDSALAKQEWMAEICGSTPRTFVHADLHAGNIRLRMSAAGLSVVGLDWESAGWGTPAVDLALEGLDLAAWRVAAAEYWPNLKLGAIRQLAAAGRVFQIAALIEWESRALDARWLRRPMKRMAWYRAELIRALASITEAGGPA
jgi:aminoglycoside phosphotransferase (APT) family kinase protein